MRRAKRSNAKGDAGVVTTVLLKYQAEYNRWPSTYAPGVKDTTDADWVHMMGPKPGSGPVPTNPKRIVFFEPSAGALAPTNTPDAGAFVDPWGKPFKFALDVDGDGQIDNPDGVGAKIRARALAWSAGPDGDYTTLTTSDERTTSWE